MNKKGFTIIEMMVVIVIVGILAAVAIPKFEVAKIKGEIVNTIEDMGIEVSHDLVSKVYDKYRYDKVTGTYRTQEEITALVVKDIKDKKETVTDVKNKTIQLFKTVVTDRTQNSTNGSSYNQTTIAGEFVIIGVDAGIVKCLETIKDNQEKNGYKYIDTINIADDKHSVVVKMRKY